jgi:perosamine synthetase
MLRVPFFRPDIGEPEIQEVVSVLRSGWITTGPRVKEFERAFAAAVRGQHAVAVNSCTAALHLAVRALGLRPGEGVLVPSLTFAATAEIVLYEGGIPILVDCDATTLNVDLQHVEHVLQAAHRPPVTALRHISRVVGILPVHVGGMMTDLGEMRAFAERHGLWVVEDAAHAFPAAWRRNGDASWQYCGENSSNISCFSFYANKTITTGEGGMVVTADAHLAERIRLLSLHGLSADAWGRYAGNGTWDYRILEAGYKYNMTDIAAAIGMHQLARAEDMRCARERIATEYLRRLADVEELEVPPTHRDRIHAWHLFPIRLRLDMLEIDRDTFIRELQLEGVSCSVHWRPLHMHPYYQQTFGWTPADVPTASAVWARLVSLPLFSSMRDEEVDHVVNAVRAVCARFKRQRHCVPR